MVSMSVVVSSTGWGVLVCRTMGGHCCSSLKLLREHLADRWEGCPGTLSVGVCVSNHG